MAVMVLRRGFFADVRALLAIMAAAALAGALGGCAAMRPTESGAAFAEPSISAPSSEEEWRREAQTSGERYNANSNDPQVAMHYAYALRQSGRRAQAVAVLEQASLRSPKNMELLGAYGRALAEVGNYQQALDVLSRAHVPERPDWRILSA